MQVAIFMDNANDGDCENLVSIYEDANFDINDRKELLKYAKNKTMSTALHLAAKNGHADIVEYLCIVIDNDCPNKLELINKENKYK